MKSVNPTPRDYVGAVFVKQEGGKGEAVLDAVNQAISYKVVVSGKYQRLNRSLTQPNLIQFDLMNRRYVIGSGTVAMVFFCGYTLSQQGPLPPFYYGAVLPELLAILILIKTGLTLSITLTLSMSVRGTYGRMTQIVRLALLGITKTTNIQYCMRRGWT